MTSPEGRFGGGYDDVAAIPADPPYLRSGDQYTGTAGSMRWLQAWMPPATLVTRG